MLNIRLRFVGVGVVVAVTFIFVLARVPAFGPDSGDIALWTTAHELIARGQTLYGEIWDHKDWGFFAFSNLFYRAWELRGLYIFAIVATLAFGGGVYLTIRQFSDVTSATLGACAAVALYVCLHSYLSIYTENYGLGFGVLALGLAFRYPVLAGVAAAVSTAIKLAGLALFIGILAVFAMAGLRDRKRGDSRWIRMTIGAVIAGALILAWCWFAGSLPGWFDAIDYNREYSALRKARGLQILDIVALYADVWAQPKLHMLIMALVAALIVLFLTFDIMDGQAMPARAWLFPFAASATILVAASVGLAPQRPLAYQHYQYLAGPLILVVVVAWLAVAHVWSHHRIATRGLWVAGLWVAAAVLTEGGAQPDMPEGLRRWATLNNAGHLYRDLARIPPNMTLAVFGQNAHRLDLRLAPPGTRLACRHFYQFAHLMKRYGAEIGACLDRQPDLVLWDRDADQGGGEEYLAMRQRTLAALKQTYTECHTADASYQIFARDVVMCPRT